MYSKIRHFDKNISLVYPHHTDFRGITSFLARVDSNRSQFRQLQTLNGRKWIESCIPTFKNQINLMSEGRNFPKLFQLCNTLKFHRREIFNMAEKMLKYNKIQYFQEHDKLQILKSFINMKHKDNKQLKQNLRNSFLKNDEEWGTHHRFFKMSKFIMLILMDDDLTPSQKEGLLKIIVLRLRIQDNSERLDEKFNVFLSKIYELAKIQNLKLDQQFSKLIYKGYSSMRNIPKDFENKKLIQKIIIQNQEEKKKFESIFQLIFQDFLLKNGYQFESTVFLCNNEYDILVSGIKSVKNYPFQNIDLNQNPSSLPDFSVSELMKMSTSISADSIVVNQKFSEKIVIDLHGPCHYIDSDDPTIHNTITKTEESRYTKLPLYGIHKYNFVYYKEWEQKSKYPGITTKFIQQVLQNAKELPKISATV